MRAWKGDLFVLIANSAACFFILWFDGLVLFALLAAFNVGHASQRLLDLLARDGSA